MPSCRSSSSCGRRSTPSRSSITDVCFLRCLSSSLFDACCLLEFVSRAMRAYRAHGGGETQHADTRMYIDSRTCLRLDYCRVHWTHWIGCMHHHRQLWFEAKLCGVSSLWQILLPISPLISACALLVHNSQARIIEGVRVVQLPSTRLTSPLG